MKACMDSIFYALTSVALIRFLVFVSFSYHICIQRLEAVRVVGLSSIPRLQIFLFMLAIDPTAHCCICEVVCGTHTHTSNTYLCTADCHAQTHNLSHTHTHTQKLMMVYSHMAALLIVYAGKRSCLKSFCHKLSQQRSTWRQWWFTRHTHSQPDMGLTGLGKNPFKEKLSYCLSWPQ